MSKELNSIVLWIIGSLFFMFSSVILFFCLLFLPREKTFANARRLFSILIRLMGIKLHVEGRDHIQPGKAYLIMGNHQSLFDLFVIPSAIPLCFVAVEAAYHFKLPVWGYLITKWGCIPIERHNLKKAILSLTLAKERLKAGISLGILPEGHRTLTGKMRAFKKGPFHLAKEAGADILPFGINGLFTFQRKGSYLLTPGTVRVKIGEPIPYSSFRDKSVEQIRQELFDTISQLSR